MLRSFRLEEPHSVSEAAALLARYGESARIYAGGTELLLAMKEKLVNCERLINIKTIPELDHIELEDSTVRIGALATHQKLEDNKLIDQCLPSFAAMERNVANVRVRGVGTLGGNLCFAEPHSDPAPLLLALGATAIAEKSEGTREIPMDHFFAGAFETALAAEEILTEIGIPVPPRRSAATYIKFGYLERPTVGVAVYLALEETGEAVAAARVAVGSAGPQPKRVIEAEALFEDISLGEAVQKVGEAGEIAARVADAVSDVHGAAEYKEHLIRVIVKRAFERVISDCRKL